MLRKAMGKKIPEVMEAEKDKLLTGFANFGKLHPSIGDKLWKLIEPFAAYGFNKAHAASYGRVAYQTAYMKANYAVEYMSAVLTADAGDVDRIYESIHECERMGIEVLPPDINESFADFSVVPGTQKIRFGLTTIKNFGEAISEAIIEDRKAHGSYTSMQDFLFRLTHRNLNKKSLEALVTVGAFDQFCERGFLYANIEHMLEFNREKVKARESAQDSLFGGSGSTIGDLALTPAPPATTATKLIWEKELLGVYVSGHPLHEFKEELAKRISVEAIKKAVYEKQEIPVLQMKGSLATGGIITAMRELITKKGDKMAFVTLGDLKDQIEMVAFPENYAEQRELYVVGNCIAVKGKLTIRNDEPSIAIERVKALAANS